MNTNQIAHVAALVGEPARTAMLVALMDGRALTARELADAAHITAATASRHLGLLVEAGLLRVQSQGRHRYHQLASGDVAQLLESLMQLAVTSADRAPQRRVVTGPKDAAMRMARTCYDHIAGRLGVALAEHLQEEGAIRFAEDSAAVEVTPYAAKVLERFGLHWPTEKSQGPSAGKMFCRACMDWSERRSHLAGPLGAVLCQHGLSSGWLLRSQESRALTITPRGVVAFQNLLGQERWAQIVG